MQHLLVQHFSVVHAFRGVLRKLDGSLILHNFLRHSGGIRVRNRDDVNATIEVSLTAIGIGVGVGDRILILRRHILANNVRDKLELTAQGLMNARLNGAHHLHRTL